MEEIKNKPEDQNLSSEEQQSDQVVGVKVKKVSKPKKELCGFEKVSLMAGEEKEVGIVVPENYLSHYNLTNRKWMIEPGEFVFSAASSAQDIRLQEKYFYNCECDYTFEYETEQIIG